MTEKSSPFVWIRLFLFLNLLWRLVFMDEKNYMLRPTQVYLIFDTKNFKQDIYLKDGISHFYTFTTDTERPHRLVPDACIDVLFEYDPKRPGHMHSYVCGTKLEYEIDQRLFHNEIFGVRFMPGNHPRMLNVTMKELLERRFDLEEILNGDVSWLNDMAQATDFSTRINLFLNFYNSIEETKPRLFGKKELLQAVKNLVYQHNGNIKIHDLENLTNYSERYINKVFIDEMGFSPKIFCKIIQFQKALETLNWGRPENMTQTAVDLGYYDQSQFIRDFKKYAGLTPLKYLKMKESMNYENMVESVNYNGSL